MVVVFQGDSITDAGRRADEKGIGSGYVKMVVQEFADTDIVFYNRGISGNRAADLAGRWQQDTMDLKPDIVTVLVGINEVSHRFAHGHIITDEQFEASYAGILKQTKDSGAKIIMMQPFSTSKRTDEWEADYKCKKAVCDKLAKTYADSYIKLGDHFDELIKINGGERYSLDGIHPIQDGCAEIAKLLTAEIKKYI